MDLKGYFMDPHLLYLFEEVKKANPDFKIARQRVEIANSFLKRSKTELLPSLEVGVQVSGDRYGKYTMKGLGIMIPISPPISLKNKKSKR